MPLRLNGSTSGYVELAAPAVAGTTVLTLPTDSIKPGMVLIAAQDFSAASSVSVNNCFSATYETYIVSGRLSASAGNYLRSRLRLSGTDASGANYAYQELSANGSTNAGVSRVTGTTSIYMTYLDTSSPSSIYMNIYSPAIADVTITNQSTVRYQSGTLIYYNVGNVHTLATAYDGITFFPDAGTITGSLRIYGLRNSV